MHSVNALMAANGKWGLPTEGYHTLTTPTIAHNHSNMSENIAKANIHKPPACPIIDRPSVILYGSIEPNAANDWQTSLAASLSDLPVAIINPRCDAWDSTWVEDESDSRFKEQVEWEMDHARVADVIAFYFKPGTLTPITLLELGMYAGTGKAVVCCPEGFYKRGNVQIVCRRSGIELLGSLEQLEGVVRRKLVAKLGS